MLLNVLEKISNEINISFTDSEWLQVIYSTDETTFVTIMTLISTFHSDVINIHITPHASFLIMVSVCLILDNDDSASDDGSNYVIYKEHTKHEFWLTLNIMHVCMSIFDACNR